MQKLETKFELTAVDILFTEKKDRLGYRYAIANLGGCHEPQAGFIGDVKHHNALTNRYKRLLEKSPEMHDLLVDIHFLLREVLIVSDGAVDAANASGDFVRDAATHYEHLHDQAVSSVMNMLNFIQKGK